MRPDDANADFETKSGTDIKLGLARYFADPECDILCLRYKLPGSETIHRWWPGDPPPVALLDHVRKGGRIRGWNVMFEWHAWNLIGVPEYGWPELPIEQLVDTMAEAAAMNLPQSLEACGEAVGLSADKLKSKRGKWLISKLCVPQKITRNQPYRWITPDIDTQLHEELDVYCGQDVIAEEAIARKVRRLSEWEQSIWVITQIINQRGVPVAVDEVANIHEVVKAEQARLNLELQQITGREIDGVRMPRVPKASNRAGLLRWFAAHPHLSGLDPVYFEDLDDDEEPGDDNADVDVDPFMPNLRGDTVDKMLKRKDIPDDVRRVLEIRKLVVQTSTAKFPKLLKIVADDLTLKGMHAYHGASTGRWASRGSWNVQNLTRPKLGVTDIFAAHEVLGTRDAHERALVLFGDQTMDAAVACLRGIIKAPPGFEFIDADYSSVENRVASWIAGQQDKLDMFSKGLDEYKVFASKSLFKVPYDQVTKEQRQTTKPVILGGIFGLGADGMVDYAEKMGVKMSLAEAKEAVKALREEYSKIRQCWYDCGGASIEAVKNPGQWIQINEKLSMICHKKQLWMKLPSGRLISWSRPRVEFLEAPWKERVHVGWDEFGEPVFEERPAVKEVVTVECVDTYTRKWERSKLIGSSIFQSAVQGTARDILASGIMYVEEAGYSVIMLVHDEILALVKKGWGDPEEFGRLMCKARDWFKGLPLAFEAWADRRYRK